MSVARTTDGRAVLGNVQLCGSLHSCPVCMARVRDERCGEIDTALARHFETGGGVLFLLLTMPHDVGDSLKSLLGTLSYAFKSVLGGSAWKADREGYGILGTIRAEEATHGPNGWHPHIHAVVLTESPLSDADVDRLGARMYTRWANAVHRRGLRRPMRAFCTLAPARDVSAIAHYVAKVLCDNDGKPRAAAYEMTRSDLKDGREGVGRADDHRTPLAILRDAADALALDDFVGAERHLPLWWEWERDTKGRRAIVWSRGLRGRFGLREDDEDGEVPAETQPPEEICEIHPLTWAVIVRAPGVLCDLLKYIAAHDAAYLRRELPAQLDAFHARAARRKRMRVLDLHPECPT